MAQVNGIVVWTEGIKSELAKRLPKQRKTQRDKLAILVATMLHVRSANLVELAAGLPRESDRWDMGYQWISRFLANDLVCCDTVMEPFAREILARLAETGEPIPLILDQTTASDRHQILMLSVRWGERALPLAWRVEETEGTIGFATQKELLAVVAGWLPADLGVVLLADRFYATPAMIRWCRDRGWDYRLRLKGNLLARWGATKTTTGGLALSGGHDFEAVALTGQRVTTNIGIICDPGHAEPWIIAMAAKLPEPEITGETVVLTLDEMWHFLKKRLRNSGFGERMTLCVGAPSPGCLVAVMMPPVKSSSIKSASRARPSSPTTGTVFTVSSPKTSSSPAKT